LANDGVDLKQVIIVIEKARQEQSEAKKAASEMEKARSHYEERRRGQKHMAKAIDLLKTMPPDDPNYYLYKPLSNAVLEGSTITDIKGKSSPPPCLIRHKRRGPLEMPWLPEARDGLRQAGVSEKEDREALLTLFDLKRKQLNPN
jgi:hypothetical protein